MNKAVFLDRDGTINVEKNYLYKIEEWEWADGAIQAIKGFNELGFYVIVVSNQSGIARGLFSEDNVKKLHIYVNKELIKNNAKIDEFYYCPHHPKFSKECDCRKPNIGMIKKAKIKYNINLEKSFFIGDRISDIQTALNSSMTPILVLTGHGKEEVDKIKDNVLITENIYEAYKLIRDKTFKSK